MQPDLRRGSTGVLSPARGGRSLKEVSPNVKNVAPAASKSASERRDYSPAPSSVHCNQKHYSPLPTRTEVPPTPTITTQEYLPPAIRPPHQHQQQQQQQPESEVTVPVSNYQAASQPKRAQSPTRVRQPLSKSQPLQSPNNPSSVIGGGNTSSQAAPVGRSQAKSLQSPSPLVKVSPSVKTVNAISRQSSLRRVQRSDSPTRSKVNTVIQASSQHQATSQPKRAQSPVQSVSRSVSGATSQSARRQQSPHRSQTSSLSHVIDTSSQPKRAQTPVKASRTMSPVKPPQTPKNKSQPNTEKGLQKNTTSPSAVNRLHASVPTGSPRRLGKATARISESSTQLLLKILSDSGTESVSSTRAILQTEGDVLSLYRAKIMRKRFTEQKRAKLLKQRQELNEMLTKNEGWVEMLGNIERQELGYSAAAAWAMAGDSQSIDDSITLLRAVSNHYTKIMNAICTDSRIMSLEGLGVILGEAKQLLVTLAADDISSTEPLSSTGALSRRLYSELSVLSERLPDVASLSADVASRQMQVLQQASATKLIE